jgi:hypothetical protein
MADTHKTKKNFRYFLFFGFFIRVFPKSRIFDFFQNFSKISQNPNFFLQIRIENSKLIGKPIFRPFGKKIEFLSQKPKNPIFSSRAPMKIESFFPYNHDMNIENGRNVYNKMALSEIMLISCFFLLRFVFLTQHPISKAVQVFPSY